jgi:hypothetical protein
MRGFVLKPAIDSGRRTAIGPREAAEAPEAKTSGDLVKCRATIRMREQRQSR